ncbi:MAG: PH domain-containing protein [Bacilli bacterium]|nr:PH domain-containing protein [Bacilli bacterium]
METVYEHVLQFKKKYPLTIGWRLKKNSHIVEKHLNPGEKVLYAFIAQKNDNPLNILSSAVVALTNKRLLVGRKRVIFGYFLNAITPDMFNDLEVSSGIIWGKIYINSVKENVTLSNITKGALSEIETAISSYMMEEKKKYVSTTQKNKS